MCVSSLLMRWFFTVTTILVLILSPNSSPGEEIRGVYGVPSLQALHPSNYIDRLNHAHINAVFVSGDRETVEWFKKNGFKVYVSVNVFGGTEAWEKYPDCRPVTAEGKLLGAASNGQGSGGVCPTHQAWRRDRLTHIEKLVPHSHQENGIDGIWLDFIRYPGLWESLKPEIPDTCYCPRCLQTFRHDTKINLADGISGHEAASWIKEHCPYEWMVWKKEQIESFVAQVKKIIGNHTLGLFLVPWTKGEQENAISFKIAQDPFHLSSHVDVISPMVYHKMCGQPESWVGAMTEYYKETTHCEVWPIVQSLDCTAKELSNSIHYAGEAGADGILVFSFKGMNSAFLWKSFDHFQPPPNLITNSEFSVCEGTTIPTGWETQEASAPEKMKSTFLMRSSAELTRDEQRRAAREISKCLGISAGNDQAGMWFSPLPDGEAGVEYLFTGDFFRDNCENGVYPSISIWGQEFYLNTHWLMGAFQPLRVYVPCPQNPSDRFFRFVNPHAGKTFWLTNPRLTKSHCSFYESDPLQTNAPAFFRDCFPVGVYGAKDDTLKELRETGINTVIVGGPEASLRKTALACQQLGLHTVFSVPRDPDRLPLFLSAVTDLVQPGNTAFYVNDEPGTHSFPLNRAHDINQLIREKFPHAATCMAVVRPQVCRDYRDSASFFMLDQYPIPYMPMTWLSDSMDQAAASVGRDRLASVIQAFGGAKWSPHGWPRMPTWQEMDCLAFLSIIHGSRGIFFYTYDEIGATDKGRESLKRVVGRLNRLAPWLLEKNLDQEVTVEMVSLNQFDPQGRAAVHCAIKRKDQQYLLLAVNAIGTFTEAVFQFAPSKHNQDVIPREWQDVFSGTLHPLIDGTMRTAFEPYETKAFIGGSRKSPEKRPQK